MGPFKIHHVMINQSRFQASTAVRVSSALFKDFMQRIIAVVYCGRFGKTYRFHRSSLALEDGTDG